MASHCLRPEFTHQLLDVLLQGKSINLISPHGQGRRRTLLDVRRIFPQSWRVIQLDMQVVENGTTSLLDECLKQIKFENISSIYELMFEMNEISIYHLMIIHNFHLLTDLNVISCLNKIEKYPYISLLCVSEEKKEQSSLLATDFMLPMVSSAQLLAEIKRRDWPLEKEERVLLVDFLLQQASPYSLLDEKTLSWFVNRFVERKDECKGCTNV